MDDLQCLAFVLPSEISLHEGLPDQLGIQLHTQPVELGTLFLVEVAELVYLLGPGVHGVQKEPGTGQVRRVVHRWS